MPMPGGGGGAPIEEMGVVALVVAMEAFTVMEVGIGLSRIIFAQPFDCVLLLLIFKERLLLSRLSHCRPCASFPGTVVWFFDPKKEHPSIVNSILRGFFTLFRHSNDVGYVQGGPPCAFGQS
jgi:hypothetical protein